MSPLRQSIYEQCFKAITAEDSADKIEAWIILDSLVRQDIQESQALLLAAKAIAEGK